MRHIPRPFTREFKNHSSKSSALRLQKIDGADAASKQPFLSSGVFAATEFRHQDGYQAALKAADEVFGKTIVPTRTEDPPSAVDTAVAGGRVLPSLIDIDDAQVTQLTEDEKKVQPSRGAEKSERASSGSRKKPVLLSESGPEAQQNTGKELVVENSLRTRSASTLRRERSSIQKRWVFKTEPGAGQKWKKRLPKPAR